ncbi:MAG: CPBP family intramembrane glutamic endopeptidase [Chthoniobacterales bacterium]
MIFPYTPYIALLLSVLSLWIPCKGRISYWQIFLFLGLCCGVLTHGITLWGAMVLVLVYLLVEKYQNSSSTIKNILWGVLLLIGLILLMRLSPVALFYNLPVLTKIQFTPDAIPFSLSFHFEGVAIGVIIIGLTLKVISTLEEWKQLLLQVFLRVPVMIVVLLALSLALGFVRWYPKNPQHLVLWMMSNLFFTCVAEEGFFRGFFQEFLTKTFPAHRVIGVVIPALFFGVIHYRGGPAYMF